jgi:hypothetical protein
MLSDEALEIVGFKRERVITPLAKTETGVLFGCGDCWRAHEALDHYCQRIVESNPPDTPRPHLYMRNGGPLRLAHPHTTNPEVAAYLREEMFGEIDLGLRNVGVNRIILFGHWPCGQARQWGYGVRDAAALFAQACELAQERYAPQNALVVARYHVDWTGMRTDKPMETFAFDADTLGNGRVRPRYATA